ncbi:hypothetical protein [Chamaesiphon polymorphus]|uniref:Low temperature-induced protein n=1 Tax=Chamaesiphon polymorphus CCALA 037 TaxID=2107692 RepID=A0A2T1GGS2_9CYAN|nr:hypothetical protein [Chamaesiphon polymorphus]PSB56868.1 hypothetical protein C7B77_10340 [Chamaesiphon polymorphus CCALA 037]PSB56878.1 hypothetical protein C7B77_10395 [Chamaesiphon polymorphus CCALA 037]
MKYLASLLSNIRPVRILVSIFFAAVLIFSSSVPAFAANSDVHKGVDQLPQIEDKSLETLDKPPLTLDEVTERSQGALNEVQPNAADSDKMYRNTESSPKLPIVKQAERALDKLKNG